MPLCTTLSTGLRLRRIPYSHKFTCNKSLGRDGLIDKHSSCRTPLKIPFASRWRRNLPVVRQAANNNRIQQLDRELVQLDNRNTIFTVAEENSTARNLDTWLIKGGILGDFGIQTYNPCVVACFPLNGNDVVNINSGLVEANDNVLAGNNRVDPKTHRKLLLYTSL